MRIPSGVTDQYVYFVAVDSTDFTTRETGLSSFTVYRSRNGGAAAAMTTPTINETDTTNMPGVYELLLDEDMTIDSGDDTQEMVFHITHAGMAPVTRTIELYRPKITAGETLTVSGGIGEADTVEINGSANAADGLQYHYEGVYLADSGTTTTLVDAALTQSDTDYWKGAMICFYNPVGISGLTRMVTAFDPATDTLTFYPALPTAAGATTVYRLCPGGTANVLMWDTGAVPTPAVTGVPDVNVTYWQDTATTNSATSNKPEVDAYSISDDTTTADNVESNIAYLDASVSSRSSHSASAVTTDMDANSTELAKLGTFQDYGSGATVAGNLTDMAGTTFSASTDSLEQIRDNLGGTSPFLLQTTTIATLASQTSFTLTAGSADDDAYNGALIIVTDLATSTQKAVGLASDYTGVSRTVTLESDPGIFTMAVGDTVDVIAVPSRISNVTLTDTITTYTGNTVQTGDAFARLGAPAGASVSADIASVQVDTTAIVADTNELQTDWVDGGRLDLLIDAILVDTGTTLENHLTDIKGTGFAKDTHSLTNIEGYADLIDDGTSGLAKIATDVAAILVDTAEIGAAGAGLTAVPWNAAWDAQVESEVDDALVARGLHYIVNTALPTSWAVDVTANSALDYMADDGTAVYDRTTDSLQAVRDRGDSAWITATGFSTHTAADVRTEMDSNSTQLAAIVADTNELQADWVNGGRLDLLLDAVSTHSAADVWTAVTRTLTAATNITSDASAITMSSSGVVGTVNLVNTTTTNTDMRGTDSALLAASAPTNFSDLAIVASTGEVSVNSLTSAAITDVWSTDTLTEAYAADGAAATPAQLLYMIWSLFANKDVTGTTLTAYKLDGTTTSMTFTLDDGTSPTSHIRAT